MESFNEINGIVRRFQWNRLQELAVSVFENGVAGLSVWQNEDEECGDACMFFVLFLCHLPKIPYLCMQQWDCGRLSRKTTENRPNVNKYLK